MYSLCWLLSVHWAFRSNNPHAPGITWQLQCGVEGEVGREEGKPPRVNVKEPLGAICPAVTCLYLGSDGCGAGATPALVLVS